MFGWCRSLTAGKKGGSGDEKVSVSAAVNMKKPAGETRRVISNHIIVLFIHRFYNYPFVILGMDYHGGTMGTREYIII